MIALLAGLARAACAPAPLVGAEGLGSGDGQDCALFDLDLAGRAGASFPDTGVTRGVGLQWARAEVGLRSRTDVQARVALVEGRSGGPDAPTDLPGDALVPVIQIAEARWDWRAAGLAVAAGLVDDPWTTTVQSAWGLREIGPPMVTDQGFTTRADEGGWLSWSAPGRRLTVTFAALAGEGLGTADRNDGVDASGLLVLRPLPEAAFSPELAIYAREGSKGLLSARDHRLAAAALLRSELLVAGLEARLGEGLGGDGALLPAGISAFARAGAEAPLVAWARADLAWADRTRSGSRELVAHLGGGPRLPFGDLTPTLAVVVGWEGRRYGPEAAPIAGAGPIAATDLFFVQVGTRFAPAVPLSEAAR